MQLDGATNATISVKGYIIDQNLSTLANKVGLSESEVMELEEGKVVTKGEEGKMFSAVFHITGSGVAVSTVMQTKKRELEEKMAT